MQMKPLQLFILLSLLGKLYGGTKQAQIDEKIKQKTWECFKEAMSSNTNHESKDLVENICHQQMKWSVTGEEFHDDNSKWKMVTNELDDEDTYNPHYNSFALGSGKQGPSNLDHLKKCRPCNGNKTSLSATPFEKLHWTPNQQAWMWKLCCRPSTCLHVFNIQRSKISKRKEIRMTSSRERQVFFDALNDLKMDLIDGISKYSLLVNIHHPYFSPEAHSGPSFLPFHREYLKVFELALIEQNPSVALPFWNYGYDEMLPNPKDSVLWTNEFFGNEVGPITSGPCANYEMRGSGCLCGEVESVPLLRNATNFGTSYSEGIQNNLKEPCIYQINSCEHVKNKYKNLEYYHGHPHLFVGGHMGETDTSSNDPIFWMHHSFIDYVWEQYRSKQQDPLTDYCNGTVKEVYRAYSRMKPFWIRNVDGMSEDYSNVIEYEPLMNTQCYQSGGTNSCLSPYLFCHKRRCMSKVRIGGHCRGFAHTDICYNSTCWNGVCTANGRSDPPGENNLAD